jgi:hypothetical protein
MEPLQVSYRLKWAAHFVSSSFITYFFESAEKTVNLQENVNPDLIMSMTQGAPTQLTGVQGRKEKV